MRRLKLGVRLESLALPLRQGLAEAERLGLAGVQVDAVGNLSPKQLSLTGRRELSHLLRSHSVELAALNCPLRRGLATLQGLDARIDYIQRVMSLSFDLGARLVLIDAGTVRQEPDSDTDRQLQETLLTLARHGDRIGTVLSLEAGIDPGEALAEFLSRFDTGALGITINPANVLLHGHDLEATIRVLQSRLVYCQAQDARPVSSGIGAREVPLGHGKIDWMRLIDVLVDIDYHNWMVIRQDTGENRLASIGTGVQLLRRLLD